MPNSSFAEMLPPRSSANRTAPSVRLKGPPIASVDVQASTFASAAEAASPVILAVEQRMGDLVRAHSTGLLQEAALAHISVPGRRIRVRLAVAAAEALKVPRLAITPWATAVELLHNATLVHDDLQDRDEVRRGQPTTWKRYGDSEAVNVGDLLLMLPALTLDHAGLSENLAWRLTRALHRRAVGCVDGQSGEQRMLEGEATSWDEWTQSARGKTGHLFALPVEGAALLAGHSPDAARGLGDAFASAGVVFQIVDDVLDLFGPRNAAGRGHGRRGGDLYEGRVSVLVVEHLRRVPEDRAHVLQVLRTPASETSADAVRDLAKRFVASGAVAGVLEHADEVQRRVLQHPSLVENPTLVPLCSHWLTELTTSLEHVDTTSLPF